LFLPLLTTSANAARTRTFSGIVKDQCAYGSHSYAHPVKQSIIPKNWFSAFPVAEGFEQSE